MAQPLRVTVGPLVAADDDAVSTTQKAASASYLVVNGAKAAGTFSANGICLSQSPGGAVNLTLNGATVNSTSGAAVAYLPALGRVYITSAGNDSGRTFTVYGTIFSLNGPISVVETVTGANASTVSTSKQFQTVTRIAISGASAAAVTVGYSGVATLDMQRRIILTSGGDDTGITFTLSGTDQVGSPISEVVTGVSGSAASSVLSYKTVTSILTSGAVATTVIVGTNTTADSVPIRFDDFASNAQVTIQVDVTGTLSTGATVQETMNDPNFVTNSTPPNTFLYTPATLHWIDHPDAGMNDILSGSVIGAFAYAPLFARLTVTTTGSASATATFRQAYMN